MDSKNVFWESEGDAYFERNLQAESKCSGAAIFLTEFLKKYPNISRWGVKSYSKLVVREAAI